MKYVRVLYFLVVAQLAARRQRDAWLPTAQLVELLQAWLALHDMKCDWRDRIWLGHASLDVARSMYAAYGPGFVLPFISPTADSARAAADARERRALLRGVCSRYLNSRL